MESKTKKQWFQNWPEHDKLANWLYENRYSLAPLYVNLTDHLIETYENILSLVNFCEINDYPYLLFDGLCSNIPVKQDDNWYMSDNEGRVLKSLKIVLDEIKFKEHIILPHLNIDLLNCIKDIKKYYTDNTIHKFIHNRKSDEYHKGNDGHPNELGSMMWSRELTKIVGELYE
jgi:hypothetical protein